MKLIKKIFCIFLVFITISVSAGCAIFKKSDCGGCPDWGKQQEQKNFNKNEQA